MTAIELIQKHEGLRLRIYADSLGIPTIGYGRNLAGRGISSEEALMMLQRDYTDALNEALRYAWYNDLNDARAAVVIDMIFNLGAEGFAKFTYLIDCLGTGDFHGAAAAMLNSAWAHQVGNRAIEDASIIDTGNWP